MSKIDVIRINSENKWINIGTKNCKEITLCNTGSVVASFSFAIGPSTLANGTADTNAYYYIKTIKVPVNATLLLDEQWFANISVSGMTLFTNSITDGVGVRSGAAATTTLLVRTGVSASEIIDMIILRR
tara:strand:+ start:2588 stop:2974 length:387 start_codon:yes stop_codon:yes gene_type:complete